MITLIPVQIKVFAKTSILAVFLIVHSVFADEIVGVKALVDSIIEIELYPALKQANRNPFLPAFVVLGVDGATLYKTGDEDIPLRWGSAMKLIFSVLIMSAADDNMISSLDESIMLTTKLPLKGEDKDITWRQLMSMTSCFDDDCTPGTRFAYTDRSTALFAVSLKLLYKAETLEMAINKSRLAEMNLPSRVFLGEVVSLATTDFAQIGYMLANDGMYKGKVIIRKSVVRNALQQVVPSGLPISESENKIEFSSNYLNLARIGGGNNKTKQTADGPGKYVANSWLINTNSEQMCYAANGNTGGVR